MLTLLSGLGGLVASVGSFALFGGPIGVVVAWLGTLASNTTIKLVLVGVGLLIIVATTIGLTVHIQHLERDRELLRVLKKQDDQLAEHFGCGVSGLSVSLAVCISQKEAEQEKRRAVELEKQRQATALANAKLATLSQKLDMDRAEMERFLQESSAEDGPIPQIMRDYYARQRKSRGFKP